MDTTKIPIYEDQGHATYRTGEATSRTAKLYSIMQRYVGVFLPLFGLYLAIAVIASSPAFARRMAALRSPSAPCDPPFANPLPSEVVL
jgi:hypothetical protein